MIQSMAPLVMATSIFFSSAKVFQDVMLETRGNTVDYGTELRHHRALCAWQTRGEVGTNETILIPWG